MTMLRPTLLALVLSASPALALGPTIDLPRLDFGTPEAHTTRACADPAHPGAPTACVKEGGRTKRG